MSNPIVATSIWVLLLVVRSIACARGSGAVFPINGRMRNELLNETLFFDREDARAEIANWVAEYNLQRPHSSLEYLIPRPLPPTSPQRTIE